MNSAGWDAGTRPWVRAEAHRRNGVGAAGDGFVTCYFCGQSTAKISLGDLAGDTARVDVYCDSQACDAREIAVVVLRDNSTATPVRADVRALRAIDDNTAVTDARPRARGLMELLDDPDLTSEAIIYRRTSAGPVHLDRHGSDG